MSILMTESFARWAPYTGPNNTTVDKVDPRRDFVTSFPNVGWASNLSSWESYYYPKLHVGLNPVTPEQNALVFVMGIHNGGTQQICIPVTPVPGAATVYGMSVYIPPEFPEMDTVTNPMISLSIGDVGARGWSLTPSAGNDPSVLFHIGHDRRIRNDTLQSNRQVPLGKQTYMEARVDGKQLSVWMDDILVYQNSNTSMTGGPLIITVSKSAGGGNAALLSNIAMANFYALAEDGIAPSQRLGPTTRVIGSRPSVDVDVEFTRPDDMPSNASVAAAPMTLIPSKSLQTAKVGTTDFYKGNGQLGTENAAMVHAITVKGMAASLDSVPHAFQATMRHEGVEDFATNKQPRRHYRGPNPWGGNVVRSSILLKDGNILTGGQQHDLWMASPETDYSNWTQIYSDRTTSYAIHALHQLPSGHVIGLTYQGWLMVLPPPPPGGYEPGTVPTFIKTSPFGSASEVGYIREFGGYTFIMVAARIFRFENGSDPLVAANYVQVGTTSSDGIHMVALKDGGLRSFARNGTIRDHLTAFDTKPTNTNSTPKGATSFLGASQYHSNTYRITETADGRLIGSPSCTSSQLIGSYSDDQGATWTTVQQRVPVSWSIAHTGYATVATETHGCYVFTQYNNIFWTTDGKSWSRYPSPIEEHTGLYSQSALRLPNDDIMYWNSWGVHRIGERPFQTWFPTLGAYTTAELRSTVHPVTGLPWTPEQAAGVEFGLRISS